MSSFRIIEHTVPCQHIREYNQATSGSQEDILYLNVKQYLPLSNPHPQPGDVTIIGAHANAFPKELYEPLWDDLLERSAKQGWRIRSVWIADVAHEGHSSVINESRLGNEPSWFDHSRDLLHLINVKRHDMPRPIVGVGHSMGGCQLAYLSLMHPRLLSTLILLDPVIQERSAEIDPARQQPNLAQLSTFRRTMWPSREAAAVALKKSPFYQAWDQRVFDKWIQHGLREGPTVLEPEAKSPQVTLTTTPAQEVFTYLRPNYEAFGVEGKAVDRRTHADIDPSRRVYPFYRAEAPTIYARLPELRPSVLYVFGSTSVVSTADMDEAKVARTGIGVGGSGGEVEGRVKGVTVEGAGHLVPMEDVGQTADAMAEWIEREITLFRDEVRRHEEWRAKPLIEKQAIDDIWKKMIGGVLKRAKI